MDHNTSWGEINDPKLQMKNNSPKIRGLNKIYYICNSVDEIIKELEN
jgi:hypothetical protein